ncbi:uncharacterized protein KIAA1958-like [Ptychodera flava]|uniref:uncharacterized protein KIAA1958-like n=1 Tax=Ptychodera flava TaxID=63121 RepID=UPI003969BE95
MEERNHYDWQNCMYFEHLASEFYYPDISISVEEKKTAGAPNTKAMEPEPPVIPAPANHSFTWNTTTGSSASARFANVSTDDVSVLVSTQKNKNTEMKTMREVAVFEEWRQSMTTEIRRIEDIPPPELDPLLGRFYLSVRKKNGEEYEPDSISSYQKSIDRHLRNANYGYSIMRDELFQKSRDALAAKRKQLKATGKGNLPKKSQAITEDHEKALVEAGQLGIHSPNAVLNTIWLNNTKLFGLRGSDEHRQMKWGDVSVARDENGEYLVYNERLTKTRRGEPGNTRKFAPRAYASPSKPQTCPVTVYRAYAKRRPEAMNFDDAPFYLGIEYVTSTLQRGIWFRKQPMGVNKLNTIMKSMANAAGLSDKLSNHSARKACVQRLLDAGVPPITAAQLSGHKNPTSLNRYSTANEDQQRQMSNILSGVRNTFDPRPSTSSVSLPVPAVPSISGPASAYGSTVSVSPSQPLQSCSQNTQHQFPQLPGMFSNTTITGGVFHFTFNVAGSSSSSNLHFSCTSCQTPQACRNLLGL